MIYRRLLRPLLFRFDPEDAHLFAMGRLARWRLGQSLVRRLCAPADPRLSTTVFGHEFAGPVGLAAGLDKHGEAGQAWAALGFGFAEIGTVTPLPQPGNPRPRIFRLPKDSALINRLGFNSVGAEAAARNLVESQPHRIPIGVNVGKNKDTPNELASEDYVAAMRALSRLATYWVINVSSPNTPGLRDLQHPTALRALVGHVVATATDLAGEGPVPAVLLKLDPDADDVARLDTVEAALVGGVSGFVATNTTLSRVGLRSRFAAEVGGLSGAPLRARADAVVASIYRATAGRIPIIGVGGIFSAADAYSRIRAGASLIQVYSGLIYEGPCLARRIHRGLSSMLARDGFKNLADAVGIDVT